MFGKKKGEASQSAGWSDADGTPFGSEIPAAGQSPPLAATGDAFSSLSTSAGGHHFVGGSGHPYPQYNPELREWAQIRPFHFPLSLCIGPGHPLPSGLTACGNNDSEGGSSLIKRTHPFLARVALLLLCDAHRHHVLLPSPPHLQSEAAEPPPLFPPSPFSEELNNVERLIYQMN